ncbi:MAG: hypothetical protein RLZZ488_2470 [Pseudomonadota bacterium]|jgi:D-lactate dehydrogenase
MFDQLISRDWADRIVHAHDASVYRMIPRSVARPRSIDDVRVLLTAAREEHTGLTFRTGGTSLSGQAVTNGILVVLASGWDKFSVEQDGLFLTCGPALRGAVANAALARHGRRIGPDPASIQAACLGGIVANNASGMCCGIEENSYQTIAGMKVLLASGTLLDTRRADCEEVFRSSEPALYSGLLRLRDKIRASAPLVDLIRRKASGKNTTGYTLQAFLDHSTASDILTHLLVGSEGTLGFIAEISMRTVPLRPHRASALLSFDSLESACEVTPRLRELGFSAVELLDYASIQAIRDYPQLPKFLAEMQREGACLLVQAQENDDGALKAVLADAGEISAWRQIQNRTDFFSDNRRQAELWDLRKGIFPAVGARRASGTSVIIEDVAFQLRDLAEGTKALRSLLNHYDYQDAVIYGHARDGNLHFILSQNFAEMAEVRRYERFIDDMVECVVGRFGGALKAEHGTGRNMAPFVEREWGSEAYCVMREIKTLLDPENILNPGVLLNSNPRVHLENLKQTPLADPEIDACIECGFCEPVCPSQGLTLSPRGRIVLQREKMMNPAGPAADSQAVEYSQISTCAADGLCAKACPVGINTGTWVKKVRAENASRAQKMLAGLLADELPAVEKSMSFSLQTLKKTGEILGATRLSSATRALNSALGLPVWSQHMAGGSPALIEKSAVEGEIVLLRSCVTRTMGGGGEDALLVCAQRAGVVLTVVSEAGICCGQPWSSKGFSEQAQNKLGEWIDRCFELTQQGALPLVVDNSPCAFAPFEEAHGLSEELRQKLNRLQIWDPVDLALHLARRLPLTPSIEAMRFFPVCSQTKSGRADRFEELARMLCKNPVFPLQSSCCGMAGDRGLWFPELSANATAKMQWAGEGETRGYCTSRTCEISLSQSGINFESVYVALETASRTSPSG